MASSEEESLNLYASQLDALDERLAACCDASDEPLHILQYNEEASATLRRRLNLLPTQNGALGKPEVLECLTSRVLPRVTQLLKQLTILYRDARGSLPLLQSTISTGPQGSVAQWASEEGFPAAHAVVSTVIAVRLISGIRSASLALVAPSAFSSDPHLARLRTQLTEQLLSQDTLSALAAACRFVKEQSWPAGDLVTMQEQQQQQQQAQGGAGNGAGGNADAGSDKPGKRWRKLADGGMLLERNATGGSRYDCYQDGLTLAASVLDVLCAQVDGLLRQQQLRPSDNALKAAAGRLLANVRETGVVERVAAMVLAAPPASVLLARTATGADPDGDLTGLVALQVNVMGLLKKLADMRDLAGHEAVRAVLEGPEVLRLRRALLQQLAAWRPEAGGGKGVPDEDVDAAAGGVEQEGEWEADEEEGAGGREQGEVWAALRRGALRKAMGAALQVSQIMRMMVEAAVCGFIFQVRAEESCRAMRVLLPSLPEGAAMVRRACRALCRRAEAMAPRAVQGDGRHTKDLTHPAVELELVLQYRIRGEETRVVLASVADVLLTQAWLMRTKASPVGLAATDPHCTDTSSCLSRLAVLLIRNSPLDPKSYLQQLPQAQQDALMGRLLRLRFLPTLEVLLRFYADKGKGIQAASLLSHCLLHLTVPMARASLRAWAQRRRQAAPAAAAAAPQPSQPPANTAAAAAANHDNDDDLWRAHRELGVLVTLAKIARQYLAKLSAALSSGGAAVPCDMLQPEPVAGSLVSILIGVTCDSPGVTSLLPDIDRAFGGAAAAGLPYGALAAARGSVSDLVDLCGGAALLLMGAMSDQAAEVLRRERQRPGSAGLRVAVMEAANRGNSFAMYVVSAVQYCSPAALAAVGPQRAVAAVGRMVRDADLLAMDRRDQVARSLCATGAELLGNAVVILTTDQRTRTACVPGWVWGGPGPAPGVTWLWMGAVCPMYDGAEWTETVAPGSVQPWLEDSRMVWIEGPSAAPFAGKDPRQRESHHWPLVMAVARKRCQENRTFINGEKQRTWREHFGGDGLADEAAQWPPAWVRLCSNPRCGSFAGSCEKDLGLKACTRCRSVRYCGTSCQKAHWPQHKTSCAQLAAAAAAAAAAAPAAEGAAAGGSNAA